MVPYARLIVPQTLPHPDNERETLVNQPISQTTAPADPATESTDAVLEEKHAALIALLAREESIAIAYSGGVDSTLLLACAHEALGDRAVAFTARSSVIPARELEGARTLCAARSWEQVVFDVDPLGNPDLADNPRDRCYHCKRTMLAQLAELAHARGIGTIAEGTNTSDRAVYRPGERAVAEAGVLSPLAACGLSKADVRALSRRLGLPTWDKPSSPCLLTRLPYDHPVTADLLARADAAERFLADAGVSPVRVRCYDNLARIEVEPGQFALLTDNAFREKLLKRFSDLGFVYTSLDLAGIRSGSMDEPYRTEGERPVD
jgi:uncharacterized protein